MISPEITSAVIALALAGAIIWLVRHNRLHARNALWWILLAGIIAVTGTLPGLVDAVSNVLGIRYSPILAVLIGMAVVLLKLLKTDIERAKEQQQLRILAQKVALLEAESRSNAGDSNDGHAEVMPDKES